MAKTKTTAPTLADLCRTYAPAAVVTALRTVTERTPTGSDVDLRAVERLLRRAAK